jgi:CRISPR-associated protein Cas2
MIVIVAYDVSDDDQRARLAAFLSHYGVRLQKSVFECEVDDDGLAAILATAADLLNLNHDTLHVFRQCHTCHAANHALGQNPPSLDAPYWIL